MVCQFVYDGTNWIWVGHENVNTDTNVSQVLSASNAQYPVLLSYSTQGTNTSTVDNVAYRSNKIYANPSTGAITAENFVGKINGHTVNADVPSGAKFTDTTYNFGAGLSTTGSNVNLSLLSTTQTTNEANVTNHVYPVEIDKNGKLAVLVPWINSNTTYTNGDGLDLTGTVFSHYSPASADITTELDPEANNKNIIKTLSLDNFGHIVSSTYSDGKTFFYIEGSASDAAGVWTGTQDEITEYYNGLTVMYVPKVAGKSGSVTLNINGLGAVQCYTTNTDALTTHYKASTPILFTYYDGKWRRADYNANTTYAKMTAAEQAGGTATTARSISADVLRKAIVGQADTAGYAVTASNATLASSAAYAVTAGNAVNAASASYTEMALNATHAASASFAASAIVSSKALHAASADYSVRSVNATCAENAAQATHSASAGFALHAASAGYALNAASATYAVDAGSIKSKIFYGTCDTATATTAKVVTCPEFATGDLVNGATVYVTFDYTNSGAVGSLTLNVNGTGAKPIKEFRNGGVSNIPGANYLATKQTYRFSYDGTNWVTVMDYDSNDVNRSTITYPRILAGAGGIGRYTLFMETSAPGVFSSITSTANSTGTSKVKNSVKFKLGKVFYSNRNSDIAALNSSDTTNSWMDQQVSLLDLKYSLNIANGDLTARQPLYLVGTLSDDGYFQLDDTWWTQTPEEIDNGKVYVYVGQVYPDSAPYRCTLDLDNPAIWYKDGGWKNVVPYAAKTKTAISASSAGSAGYATTAAHAGTAGSANTATTAGQAVHAASAGYALSSNCAANATNAGNANTATTAGAAITASRAFYASSAGQATTALNAVTAGRALYAGTANNAVTAGRAYYAVTANNAITAGQAVHAASATYAANAGNATHASSAAYASDAGIANTATFAVSANELLATASNEVIIGSNMADTQSAIWFNYRREIGGATAGNAAITQYNFGNGNANTTGVTIKADTFAGQASCAGYALKANSAAYAITAGNAVKANSATHATHSGSAGYALSSNCAAHATHAGSATYAATVGAHSHYELTTIGDQRATTSTPNTYANKLIFQGLKNNTTLGSPAGTTGTYSYVVGLRGWSDSSGGDSHEIAFNNNGLFHRHGATTGWGNWTQLVSNTGSWSISVASATQATHAASAGYSASAARATYSASAANAVTAGRALSAASAAWALNAANATTASNAVNAGSATEAAHSASATWAAEATCAANATLAGKAKAANITTTNHAVAVYTDTAGGFGTVQTKSGAAYATSTNGALTFGTLPLAQGGTGKTSAVDAANNFMNALTTGSSAPTDADYYIAQYAGGGTATVTYHRRPHSALWTYIKGKIDAAKYVTSVAGHSGQAVTLSKLTVGHKEYNGSSDIEIKAADLDLAKSMTFLGKTTTPIEDGSTTATVAITVNGVSQNHTAENGDVVLYDAEEFIYSSTAGAWQSLGLASSYALHNHAHGNISNAGKVSASAAIANGDSLLIGDASDSNGIARSTITFDGSTTTKALTQKGTWEIFNNYSLPDATTSAKGGVKIGSNLTITSGTLSLTKENVEAALGYTPGQEGGGGIEYIVGTQTASTNAWTGVTKEATLETGKVIAYKLPFAGTSTAATLNLTLSGGGTSGAKAVILNKNTNVTTHFPDGTIIILTYDGSQWKTFDYNTNTTYSNMSVAERNGATATTARLISAVNLRNATVASADNADHADSATYAANANAAAAATTAGNAIHAASAAYAAYALSAGTSTSSAHATHAGSATFATSAGNATYANSASHAVHAGSAGYATSAANATLTAKATAANITSTTNAIAYYTDAAGTFGSKASADGVLYSTAANGALNWGTLPIEQGGTGATTTTAARVNLKAAPVKQSVFYGLCNTPAATLAKEVILIHGEGYVEEVGTIVVVDFVYGPATASDSAPMTMKVGQNGTARNLLVYDNYIMNQYTDTNGWRAGAIVPFVLTANGWTRFYWYNTTYNIDSIFTNTASGTAAKLGSCTLYAPVKGFQQVLVMYDNTAQSKLTLNVNLQGAKDIWINGEISSSTNYTLPKGLYLVYYDGTNYHFNTDGAFVVRSSALPAVGVHDLTSGRKGTLMVNNSKELGVFDGTKWLVYSDTAGNAYMNGRASCATYAANAGSSTHASSAAYAASANSAANATHAGSATYATTAGQAVYAASAGYAAQSGTLYTAAATTKAYVLGTAVNSSAQHTIVHAAAVYTQSGVLYGACWNDYAEFRKTNNDIEPGRCVVESGNDTLELSTNRLQPGAEIVSDTFGYVIGETDDAKTPIAMTGRVLAYPYEDREIFKKNIGKPVCSGPQGTVSIMSDEEYQKYGYCTIGTVSSVPDYSEWGTGNVPVNGRIWIRVR